MQHPIPRFSDSYVLAKIAKIAHKISSQNWSLTVSGTHHQLVNISVNSEEKNPYSKNEIATVLAKSSGYSGNNFSLVIDGVHSLTISRQSTQPHDNLNVDQSWFGSNHKLFLDVSSLAGMEFGNTTPSAQLATGLSGELGKFVETRDQSLARLEELYVQFTEKVFKEREKTHDELRSKVESFEQKFVDEKKKLENAFINKENELTKRESELSDRLKLIDDRGAKHARRALRDSIITELGKRDTSFSLTKGTNSLRRPIAWTLVVAGLLFTAGLIHSALIAADVLSKNTQGFDWGLAYFILKQVTYTAGLISVIWYGIKWNDRWFREHANEEFKAKTMQIDILRANWVVETLLEWQRDRGEQIPSELLDRLTHNLFRYPEEDRSNADATGLASILLGTSSKVRLKVGGENELELSRSGAKKLSEHIAG